MAYSKFLGKYSTVIIIIWFIHRRHRSNTEEERHQPGQWGQCLRLGGGYRLIPITGKACRVIPGMQNRMNVIRYPSHLGTRLTTNILHASIMFANPWVCEKEGKKS